MKQPWEVITEARRAQGLTQMQVCTGICSQTVYSLFEQGVWIPDDAEVEQICTRVGWQDALGLTKLCALHRERLQQKVALWRAFVHQDTHGVGGLLAQLTDDALFIDILCYRTWLFTASPDVGLTFTEPPAVSGLAELRSHVVAQRDYLPKSMLGRGDTRLLVVLAMVEADLAVSCGRHAAAAYWRDRACELKLQVPRYWV
ncbi:helix-turn-helix domain-containing protein [Alicyclobacillus sacchari]|uniref:helix-turn-helix domain-containing protein n=1 Tax=Alicyclobacillus sacchari TaxID=392010 RepID=UPI001065EFD7|nr:helix-turn-helix transcriptional regulator [Alicyclobacillus sacchari]